MREPCKINLPTETFLCLPEDGQPSDTVRYRSGIHMIRWKIENGRVVLRSADVAVVREELRITRSWRNLFQPRQTWVRTENYDGGRISPTYGANRLFCHSELEDVATALFNNGVHFTTDFLDWVLSPVEEKLNKILREVNAQIMIGDNVVKLAA